MSVRHENDPQFPGQVYAVGWYCQECGFDYDTVMPDHSDAWEPSDSYRACPGCGSDPVDSAAWNAWDVETGEPVE